MADGEIVLRREDVDASVGDGEHDITMTSFSFPFRVTCTSKESWSRRGNFLIGETKGLAVRLPPAEALG